MKKKGLLFFVCILIIITACVLKYNQFMNTDKENSGNELTPASSIAISEDEAKKISNMTPIRLYFLNKDGSKLRQEIRYIPDAQAEKGNEYLSTVIINELIKGPAASSGLGALLPASFKINSVIVQESEAIVDLGKSSFQIAMNTQSPQETGNNAINSSQMMIYSIIDSLTECESITDVSFKVDGNADAQELKDLNIQGAQKKNDVVIDKSVAN